ncbi:MAG: glycoside hydrolase family 20 zincin-like fold domain-containing protein, partial [Armatimonadota bacterium]
DFEGGIEGWWGNVYGGGGACEPSVAGEAKFGAGALHCEVTGVEGGSNTVSAWFPPDAQWRSYEWGVISFWVKGDGSRDTAKLAIATGLEGEPQQSYSYPVPLDGTEWRKIVARVGSFWNRYKVPMDVPRIGRIMFGCKGTHSFDIDHIVLEAHQRPVPLDAVGAPRGIDLAPSLAQSQDGRYALRFDPTPLLPGPATVEVVVRLPQRERSVSAEVEGARARDEVAVLWDDPKQDARAEVSVVARRGAEQEVSSCRYAFDLVTAKEPPDPTALGLAPAPKDFTPREGSFPITTDTRLEVWTTDGADPGPALALLTDELKAWLGRPLPVAERRGSPVEGSAQILLGPRPPGFPPRTMSLIPPMLERRYALSVSPGGARISAPDTRGLVNGVCTLLQAIQSHYASTFELAAPALAVWDWPSLPIRAVSLPLPTNRWGHPNDAPVSEEFFTDFLRRTLVRHKLNTAVLIVQQAMQYESHPKVSGPAAWPKETVKRVFDGLRRYGVEPVPNCNSLGHANWLAIPYRELAEDGDVHQFCTSNPD